MHRWGLHPTATSLFSQAELQRLIKQSPSRSHVLPNNQAATSEETLPPNKRLTFCTSLRTWTRLSANADATQQKCRKVTGSVSEVWPTPQWKLIAPLSRSSDTTHTCMYVHSHTYTPVTGKPRASHLSCFLHNSTMDSSPDCHSHYFGSGCSGRYPYHRQTSSPRPGRTPSSPIKQITLKRSAFHLLSPPSLGDMFRPFLKERQRVSSHFVPPFTIFPMIV